MIDYWWRNFRALARINSVILKTSEIRAAKAQDFSGIGISWYRFSLESSDKSNTVKGVGADYDDRRAVLKTWGEFVERYSFHQALGIDKTIASSSGFASHLSPVLAARNATLELIERDIFLTSWLLRIPASRLNENETNFSQIELDRIHCLSGLGAKLGFGILGRCMGYFVGIACMSINGRFALMTAAREELRSMTSQLVKECVIGVSDFLSPDAPETLVVLPANASPRDHLRYYLNINFDDFVNQWLVPVGDLRSVVDFPINIKDLTSTNHFALRTGYSVFRASSYEAQNLWFGPTIDAVVNWNRLSKIAGRTVCNEDINWAPHPFA